MIVIFIFRYMYYQKSIQYFFLICLLCFFMKNAVGKYCNSNASVYFQRATAKKGFHRDIITNVMLSDTSDSTKCLMMVEHISANMYVDPYQLAEERMHGNLDVMITDEINIEAPAHKSSSLNVYVYLCPVKQNVTIILPVHLRYQKPHRCSSKGYFVKVFVKHPSFFLQIKEKDLSSCSTMLIKPCDVLKTKNCSWMPIKPLTNTQELWFETPVGCSEHIPVITVVTFLVIAFATFVLGKTLSQSENFKNEFKTE